ncbi:LysR family transcriptional regulator [Salinisphaera sp. Q1T1-3]|uniref:LysR family transcriptional regulator n=1 Tax=Salinisphaera sp. Q1T1-3 TaxID=2321229 RepID=UPI000E70E320|nr:LysR family transcriptional regulator [Salinisphaera sp. Q1T1-3]RJS91430.1 LysR family transcriptional regulator [Salinisphaera sp. Q1T1-3]
MTTRPVDLKALQTLVAVVEEGSMTAAARRLAYSQSAISMQLQRLEARFGLPLVVRARACVRPTYAGEIALAHARDMLASSRMLQERLTGAAIGGSLRFGLPADLAPWMGTIWARFAQRHPQVEMQVCSELSTALCDRLDEGRVDLALLTLPNHGAWGRLLRREPLLWVGGRGTHGPGQAPLALALGPDGGCAFRAAALEALAASGRDWRIAYEAQAFAPIAAPVGLGLAVTVAMPSMLADRPELMVLDHAVHGLPPLPDVALCLATAAGPASPAVAQLAALIMADIGPSTDRGGRTQPLD